MNGSLSHGHYHAKSQTFKCKLPGGALSSSVDVLDRMNELGETVTFTLDLGLLWRLDHLLIGEHKLAKIDLSQDNKVELEWEQYQIVGDAEVLLTSAFVTWDDQEERRELLFSIDGDYVNVIHYAQNMSSKLQNFTTSAAGFYKSCEFY